LNPEVCVFKKKFWEENSNERYMRLVGSLIGICLWSTLMPEKENKEGGELIKNCNV